MPRHIRFYLFMALSVLGATSRATPARADDSLDLRAKFTEFAKSENERRWQIEDKISQRERLFQDGLMQEYRDSILKGLDQLKDAPDWKQAQRSYREKQRATVNELKQKIRVHREEFQLSFIAATNELEKDMKEFLAPLEEQFKKNKSDAYRKAENDFQSSREDLREEFRKWKDRVKDLKTTDSFLSY